VAPGGRRDGHDRAASTSERVYRALIRAYPEEVRRRYADEMVRYFGDLCREESRSRGPKGLALLWARTLPEWFFTALKERGAMLPRNAYLPVAPRTAARWGALSALLGGSLGMVYSLAYTLVIAGFPVDWTWWDGRFTVLILFAATLLSILGMFGLYGTLVARSGCPGVLAGAGAALSGWVMLKNHPAGHLAAEGGMPSSLAEETSGPSRQAVGPAGPRRSWRPWLVPRTRAGWVLAALLILLLCTGAYAARDVLHKTFLGMLPIADKESVFNEEPVFSESKKLDLTKSTGDARVTLEWAYRRRALLVSLWRGGLVRGWLGFERPDEGRSSCQLPEPPVGEPGGGPLVARSDDDRGHAGLPFRQS
jgi:hypothetical protein